MTAERDTFALQWEAPKGGEMGCIPKGLCPVMRFPASKTPPEPAATAEGAAARADAFNAHFFTFDRSSTIGVQRLLPLPPSEAAGAAAAVKTESSTLTIAAAAAADGGVTALAAAEAQEASAPLQLFAGLTNGQLWHLEVKTQLQHPLRLVASSKQLLCCRMAEPVDVVCCYVPSETAQEESAKVSERLQNGKWRLMVIVLYSDGVSVTAWPEDTHEQTKELPPVEAGSRLAVSPLGHRVAISTTKRRLVLLERCGKTFSVLKDFTPLKLCAPEEAAAQPCWLGEQALLLPGGSQLRQCSVKSGWEVMELPPCVAAGFGLLQPLACLTEEEALRSVVGGTDVRPLLCSVSREGRIDVWCLQRAEPLVTVQGAEGGRLTALCSLLSASEAAASGLHGVIVLLREDGCLGYVSLRREALRQAVQKAVEMSAGVGRSSEAAGSRAQSDGKAASAAARRPEAERGATQKAERQKKGKRRAPEVSRGDEGEEMIRMGNSRDSGEGKETGTLCKALAVQPPLEEVGRRKSLRACGFEGEGGLSLTGVTQRLIGARQEGGDGESRGESRGMEKAGGWRKQRRRQGDEESRKRGMEKADEKAGGWRKRDAGEGVAATSVEAFLSREAAENSSAESEEDAEGEDLFDEMEAEETSPVKERKAGRRYRQKSLRANDSASSSDESEVPGRRSMELPFAEEDADAAFAPSVRDVQAQLREMQALLSALTKKQQEVRQPFLHPGGGPQPADAGKPWCLYWTQHGHITKTLTADNSILDIFNFAQGAAAEGTAHRKLADLQNAFTAALCRAGVLLAASGASHSVMEFRSFLDAGSWVKHFPEGEKILGVAAGDAFVAAITDAKSLRIFTLGGTLLYTADVFGRPVSLCASQQLLVVLTQTGCSEGALQLHCSLIHVHPIPVWPEAHFKLPISVFKRRLAAPPAAAASMPEVDILHEGFFDVEAPLDWIGVSPGGMPAVKDTSEHEQSACSFDCISSGMKPSKADQRRNLSSAKYDVGPSAGVVRGLLPVACCPSSGSGTGYAFKWVKVCSLEDACISAALHPVVIDETKVCRKPRSDCGVHAN
ncbi:hypothetical protein cyc_02719 [Cyclospora cayetanensis]|uniref:WDHD1/CFT4 second beta-propeller domain-containing protein n=1 Tax=Cyclospora cayetanensis TaxID=88456 RepID=A0A1D3CVN9_9EIME|nr:hypothetical protein cyc_02719 [Cyclospora cayetanensis]